ncbi:hypothetical protein CC85DRAFT_288416 [Cutaneotrichosporon oleaginosum]|uniref:Uncharacterized protein n=1 Tax=Cutaneotrichosporon oleaginosum TaxID=879819 RepID=A0A0J0XET0_9TREE|nr:uncharacterized protein CC85DRAFT_288416 [Cutaneotrichosporon oleaginosum]KLT39558.1 hypothetical protein CC85DRAFT_288416 [Cutaneotrichosporon oleaginosum]TXT08017.1 hypothetical protein COLE_04941 [Cutaneotrichosporon oleaginosum]
MLVSPIRVHNLLAGLLDEDGPHTVLLITPAGQLIAQASLDDEGSEPNGTNNTESVSEANDGDEGEEEDGEDGSGSDEGSEEEDDDEPYLEGPERLRLLLGLASQWEDDESPRVECELGRLFLRPIGLEEPEVPPPNAAIPAVRPPHISNFVLVLNGTAQTPWATLTAKADEFLSQW